MLRNALPGPSIVGAYPCGRPVGIPIRLSSPDTPMQLLVGINDLCGRHYYLNSIYGVGLGVPVEVTVPPGVGVTDGVPVPVDDGKAVLVGVCDTIIAVK